MRRIAAVMAGCLMLSPALAEAASPPDCGQPLAGADGWTVVTPADEGLDQNLICGIGPTLEHLENADPHAVVVVRHGALVYEHYFGGGDEYTPGEVIGQVDRNADTTQDLHSVTKSVTALLTGILVDRSELKGLDASIFSLLPQYGDLKTPEKASITPRDLLTMTSGLSWSEAGISYSDPENSWRRYMAAPDPFRFVLQRPLAAMPGTVWNYNSGGVELLGLILEKVAGKDLGQFARETLFAPLGIRNFGWGAASAGLTMRPRDLAKIGQLVLNRGSWHGRQLVSSHWIETMTASLVPPGRTFCPSSCRFLRVSVVDGRRSDRSWQDRLGRRRWLWRAAAFRGAEPRYGRRRHRRRLHKPYAAGPRRRNGTPHRRARCDPALTIRAEISVCVGKSVRRLRQRDRCAPSRPGRRRPALAATSPPAFAKVCPSP